MASVTGVSAKTEEQLILKLRDDLIKAREIIQQENELKKKLVECIRQMKDKDTGKNSCVDILSFDS